MKIGDEVVKFRLLEAGNIMKMQSGVKGGCYIMNK
jgi:hypothetical protein